MALVITGVTPLGCIGILIKEIKIVFAFALCLSTILTLSTFVEFQKRRETSQVWIGVVEMSKDVQSVGVCYEDEVDRSCSRPTEGPLTLGGWQPVRGKLAHRLQEFTPLPQGDGCHAFVSKSAVVQGYNIVTTTHVNGRPVHSYMLYQPCGRDVK